MDKQIIYATMAGYIDLNRNVVDLVFWEAKVENQFNWFTKFIGDELFMQLWIYDELQDQWNGPDYFSLKKSYLRPWWPKPPHWFALV